MFGFSPKEIEAQVLRLARYSPELLPPCIDSKQFICSDCSIGDHDSCALILNEDYLCLLRWKISNVSSMFEDAKPDEIIMNMIQVFESQGSALHVDKIMSLLRRQTSDLKISDASIKKVLKGNPEIFKEMDSNVFMLNSEDSASIET